MQAGIVAKVAALCVFVRCFAGTPLPAAARDASHREPGPAAAFEGKPCPEGCEDTGNCNRQLGVCECPIGYQGPACKDPVWPSCRARPGATEMFCGDAPAPSCACRRECEAFTCPDGICERHVPDTLPCFVRPPPTQTPAASDFDAPWNGGSDIPDRPHMRATYPERGIPGKQRWIESWRGGNRSEDEVNDGVRYYMRKREKPGVRAQLLPISRVKCLTVPGRGLALPLARCPEQCNLRGACFRKGKKEAYCVCHSGYAGPGCGDEHADAARNLCYNGCRGRGRCRRGFCHCEPGWWGRDCSSSKVYEPGAALPSAARLRVFVYDLPWTVAYPPERELGAHGVDMNYQAEKAFAEMLYQDGVTRTENPWEANMFYIPSMTVAYTSNHGQTAEHNRRVIAYLKATWPFFNRSGGLDHFLWLPSDQGACYWPATGDLANVIKVVHFGWHHIGEMPHGWQDPLPNKQWGCFHPMRDICAAPMWANQEAIAAASHGAGSDQRIGSFNATFVPPRLLFFAGSVNHDVPSYSNGVRQALHKRFGAGQHANVTFVDGKAEDYDRQLRASKFCFAPSGHGWGIRLSQYMAAGCVPVIIQDGVFQFFEDQLPYHEFSVRVAQRDTPNIAPLLAAVTEEEYLSLRAGVARYWPAFLWSERVGGQAYGYMIRSLAARWKSLRASHYYHVPA